jgi:hypothetical protein
MMSPTRTGPWWCIALVAVVGLVVALAGCSSPTSPSGQARVPAAPPVPRATTIVSLTFADGLASQHTAMTMMRAHGMVDTFYIIPDPVGTSPYYPGQTCTPSRTPATRSAGTRCTTST